MLFGYLGLLKSKSMDHAHTWDVFILNSHILSAYGELNL